MTSYCMRVRKKVLCRTTDQEQGTGTPLGDMFKAADCEPNSSNPSPPPCTFEMLGKAHVQILKHTLRTTGSPNAHQLWVCTQVCVCKMLWERFDSSICS